MASSLTPAPAATVGVVSDPDSCVGIALAEHQPRYWEILVAESSHAVLIVDDDENVLSSLRRLLRMDGYPVHTASSANEGMEILRGNPIGLVISDNAMPEVGGAEFLRRVRECRPDVTRIMLTGHADLESATAAINRGEVYRFVTKPWDPEGLRLLVRQGLEQHRLVCENLRMQALIRQQNAALTRWNEKLKETVEARTQEIKEKNAKLETLYQQLKASFINTIKVFTNLVERRDPAIGGHGRRVAGIARSIVLQMRLGDDTAKEVEVAALLHDIGKIGLPDGILNRDEGSLTPKELSLLRQHPLIGQAALQIVDSLERIGVLVRHHHERWDGKGYPDRLKGERIPLGSRIIAVADAFDHYLEAKSGSPAAFVQAQSMLGRDIALDRSVVRALGQVTQDAPEPDLDSEVAVAVPELREGMVVSRDLRAETGVLLIPQGEAIRESYIARLINLARQKVIPPTIYVHSQNTD